MSEKQPEKFKMNTDILPEGVDPALAAQRTALIADWREGKMTAEEAHEELMHLYWRTQKFTNGETNVYLQQSSYQFPVEAGISVEEASRIYNQTLQADRP